MPTDRAIRKLAYNEVRKAMRSGLLTRPEACSKCGTTPAPAKDGRSRLHAHHHKGYDAPLDVEWVCISCHFKDTPHPGGYGRPVYGEEHGCSKLSDAQARAIYADGRSTAQIARAYGVSETTVYNIKSGRKWVRILARENA